MRGRNLTKWNFVLNVAEISDDFFYPVCFAIAGEMLAETLYNGEMLIVQNYLIGNRKRGAKTIRL